MKLKSLCTILILIATFMISQMGWAKSVTLYDQPQANAKMVGTIDLSAGIIPIFSPKGDWTKVADPRNGNVGWIRNADLKEASAQGVTFTQRIMSNDKGPNAVQIIQFGPPSINTQNMQDMVQKMQLQQQSMQKAYEEMLKNMGMLFQQDINLFNKNFPVFMPIVVLPEAKPAPANKVPAGNGK